MHSNPLLLFDPFAPDASGSQQEDLFNPTVHKGLDQYGQAIPKGMNIFNFQYTEDIVRAPQLKQKKN